MNDAEPTTPKGAVAIALREARTLRHSHVGTEHLLLALLLDRDGAARSILEAEGLTADRLRDELLRSEPPAEVASSPTRLPFTPRVRQTLEASAEVARKTAASSVRSEHLLLGLLDQSEGIAARTLARFHVDLERCRRRTLDSIAKHEAKGTRRAPREAQISALEAFGEDWSIATDSTPPCAESLAGAETLVLRRFRASDRKAALLCGAAGSGKTTAARRIAAALALSAPDDRNPRRLIALSVASLVAGARHRGKLEERVQALCHDAFRRHAALFVDDLHLVARWRSFASAFELATIRFRIPTLAATTPSGLEYLCEHHTGLVSRFEVIRIAAPDGDYELRATADRAQRLAAHHEVSIPDTTIRRALQITGGLAAALGLLDRCAARLHAANARSSPIAHAALRDAVQFEREADLAAAEGDEVRSAAALARARAARETAHASLVTLAPPTTRRELTPDDLLG